MMMTVFDDLIFDAKKVIQERKEYEEKTEKMKKTFQVISQSEEVRNGIFKLMEQDSPIIQRALVAAKQYDEYKEKRIESEALKDFNAIFSNMSSKTFVVAKRKDSKGHITVGRHGFGIKEYEMSKRLEDLSDLREVYECKAQILMRLNEEKKFNWVKKLEKFIEIVPTVEDVVDIRIKLPAPIVCVTDTRAPREFTHIDFDSDTRNYSSSSERVLNIEFHGSGEHHSLAVVDDAADMENEELLIYYQFSKMFDSCVIEFEERVDKMRKDGEVAIKKLYEAFGRELMLHNV